MFNFNQKAFIAFSFFAYLAFQPVFILIKFLWVFNLPWLYIFVPAFLIIAEILVCFIMQSKEELKTKAEFAWHKVK
jgi:hypothetical protein